MIREAVAGDIQTIVSLGARQLLTSHYGQYLALNPEAMIGLATGLIEQPNGVIFVADVDGQIVGMIGLITTPHPYTHEMTMSEWFWYVAPEHRGGGVRLLRKAEQWAKTQDVKHIIMAAPNEKVAGFYQRLGYKPLEMQFIKTI